MVGEKDVWDLLTENGYYYSTEANGWTQAQSKLFISNFAFFHFTGDVRDFLLTGKCRNLAIFNGNGLTGSQPQFQELGMRAHKDGKLVNIRRVK